LSHPQDKGQKTNITAQFATSPFILSDKAEGGIAQPTQEVFQHGFLMSDQVVRENLPELQRLSIHLKEVSGE